EAATCARGHGRGGEAEGIHLGGPDLGGEDGVGLALDLGARDPEGLAGEDLGLIKGRHARVLRVHADLEVGRGVHLDGERLAEVVGVDAVAHHHGEAGEVLIGVEGDGGDDAAIHAVIGVVVVAVAVGDLDHFGADGAVVVQIVHGGDSGADLQRGEGEVVLELGGAGDVEGDAQAGVVGGEGDGRAGEVQRILQIEVEADVGCAGVGNVEGRVQGDIGGGAGGGNGGRR